MNALHERQAAWRDGLTRYQRRAEQLPPPAVEGTLTRMIGLTLEAAGCEAAVGDRCDILSSAGVRTEAEVVGFSGPRLFLMPTSDAHGLSPNARVVPHHGQQTVRVGEELLGRVIDGAGRPLDGAGTPDCQMPVQLMGGAPINPLAREPITEPLDVGVRAINALLTVGRGQRIGLFAGSGVGKSVLLGMMARYTAAEVIVVGLIGERGREVKEFIERILGDEGRRRAVVVAVPADQSPLMRLHGAWLATAVAEYFRDQGRSVLLLMDSLTRFAQAQREIGLAIGEAPATKGYPPSVFARLPKLVERAGNAKPGGGSITAFYTVLTEGDDPQDPIADSARAILDGHVVLSRDLADAGHYPAIDVEMSISRAMHNLVPPEHMERVRRFKRLYARYRRDRDLINVGAYAAGSDPLLDQAIAAQPRLEAYLQQDMHARVELGDAQRELTDALGGP